MRPQRLLPFAPSFPKVCTTPSSDMSLPCGLEFLLAAQTGAAGSGVRDFAEATLEEKVTKIMHTLAATA